MLSHLTLVSILMNGVNTHVHSARAKPRDRIEIKLEFAAIKTSAGLASRSNGLAPEMYGAIWIVTGRSGGRKCDHLPCPPTRGRAVRGRPPRPFPGPSSISSAHVCTSGVLGIALPAMYNRELLPHGRAGS